MDKPVVSLIKHDDTYESLKEAVEYCDGFGDLNKEDKILIKPNLVGWDFELPFPPYGVLTTSAVVFSMVRLLYENGYKNIAVGEGALGVSNSMTYSIYEELGYDKLQDKYGVKLIDLNNDEFEDVDFGDITMPVSKQ